jgi:hypothetical protein
MPAWLLLTAMPRCVPLLLFDPMDIGASWEDAARVGRRGARMRYKVGAEQMEQVPSLAHRPDGVFGSARTTPVGPTHAVDASGAAACGIATDVRNVLDEDWEEALFVEKCADCFATVLASGHR